jgi:hypothetical protein
MGENMKKLLVFILAALAAVMSLNAEELQNKRHNFSIGAELSSYKYKEPGSNGHSMSLSGTLKGIWAEYIMKGKPYAAATEVPYTYFLGLEGSFLTGNMDYDGWLVSTNPPPAPPTYTKYKVSGIDDYIAEMRFKTGALAQAGKNLEIQPYTGLAARYIEDNLQKRNPYGYQRTDLYIYIPFGVKAKVSLPRNWALTLGGELDWLLMGKQNSRMSDINPYYNNLTFDQSNGYGARLSARGDKAFKKTGIFIEPFFRYWNIKESDPAVLTFGGAPVGMYVEPDNTTTEFGLRAGLFF